MNWLKYVGDTDILREATQASTVFMFRARREWKLNVLAVASTLLLLFILVLLILGPEGSGISWATREVFGAVFSVVLIAWLLFMGYLFFKYTPGRNDRVVLGLRHYITEQVDPLEEQIRGLSEDALRGKTAEFKQRLTDGESIDAIRPEAYACIREASRRAREHRQFECQLIGGRVLENNNVAEMRTGEGKTIVCYMGNYMKVLQGLKVHMVTTNDYLVKRDAEFCQPIFELLGVSVGYISSAMETYGPGVEERRRNYACDITYGTNSEFGFDYLRDNMKYSTRDQVQGKQHYVVVDEVDSILIDEARTPLIISGPARDDLTNYKIADGVAQNLIRKQHQSNREMAARLPEIEANPSPDQRQNPKFAGAVKKFKTDPLWLTSDEADALGHLQYFVVELDRKSAHMTEHGAKLAQGELGIGTFYDSRNMNWPHYIDNAIRAHLTYQRDRDYVIEDGAIVIVDEFTGRKMVGRQWSDGLHQAVEAKERVTIKQESQTLATITLQNLFKLYEQLAGMTGTALTESEEFMKIYQLEVIAIPTNRPIRRLDFNDKIYRTKGAKFDAIVDEIHAYSSDGAPLDPFSMYETLKIARRTLKEAEYKGLTEENVTPLIEKIDAAFKAFKGGDGDSKPLYTAFYDLMGSKTPGRPVLVGTVSVEASEKLSEALQRRYGIDHEVLNAKNHAREAEIITKAGQQHEQVRGKKKMDVGNVTISTNMAGRGTDIRLGEGVAGIGGLHVVGSDRHESRRIDNQLRGRCGRQGDAGSSRFFLSVEDDLLRLFMGEWMLKMLEMLGFEGNMAIEDKRLSRGIENAQKKVEERNFGIRKNLLEYDEVMAHQRGTFYSMRQQIVEGRGLSELIWQFIDETVEDAVSRYFDPRYPANCVAEWVAQNLNVQIDGSKLDTNDLQTLQGQVRDQAVYEVQSNVRRTFGEYIDPDMPADDWDVRGLTQWISGFNVNISQNQIRKMNPDRPARTNHHRRGRADGAGRSLPPATLHRQDTAEVTTSPLGAG
jgi:preprotein translocase subunit SecA